MVKLLHDFSKDTLDLSGKPITETVSDTVQTIPLAKYLAEAIGHQPPVVNNQPISEADRAVQYRILTALRTSPVIALEDDERIILKKIIAASCMLSLWGQLTDVLNDGKAIDG